MYAVSMVANLYNFGCCYIIFNCKFSTTGFVAYYTMFSELMKVKSCNKFSNSNDLFFIFADSKDKTKSLPFCKLLGGGLQMECLVMPRGFLNFIKICSS